MQIVNSLRDIDEAVAEHIMGWRWRRSPQGRFLSPRPNSKSYPLASGEEPRADHPPPGCNLVPNFIGRWHHPELRSTAERDGWTWGAGRGAGQSTVNLSLTKGRTLCAAEECTLEIAWAVAMLDAYNAPVQYAPGWSSNHGW